MILLTAGDKEFDAAKEMFWIHSLAHPQLFVKATVGNTIVYCSLTFKGLRVGIIKQFEGGAISLATGVTMAIEKFNPIALQHWDGLGGSSPHGNALGGF